MYIFTFLLYVCKNLDQHCESQLTLLLPKIPYFNAMVVGGQSIIKMYTCVLFDVKWWRTKHYFPGSEHNTDRESYSERRWLNTLRWETQSLFKFPLNWSQSTKTTEQSNQGTDCSKGSTGKGSAELCLCSVSRFVLHNKLNQSKWFQLGQRYKWEC